MAERLTEYDSHGDLYVKNHDYISASYKLAHYEDLEEQGRLIELPCAIGSEIWMIVTTNNAHYKRNPSVFVKPSKLTWHNLRRVLIDFGNTVFLTKEEAEEKLKERGGAENEIQKEAYCD